MHKLYQPKELKFGFILLCPNSTLKNLNLTQKIIRNSYNCNYFCVSNEEIPGHIRSGPSLAEMINAGLKHTTFEWNLLFLPNKPLDKFLNHKYSLFIENEKDIIYPIVNRKLNFIDSVFNGVFLHKNVIKDVGEFPCIKNFDTAKLFWATLAMERGYRFKGIVR